MKNLSSLLIITLVPLFVTNCSVPQATTQNLPEVHYPTPPTKNIPLPQQESTPSLGTSISLPPQIIQEQTLPNFPHIKDYGASHITKKFTLPKSINETSGLIKIDNQLWTHNDSGGASKLYRIDERNGDVTKTVQIDNAHNRDWEDIAYDNNYVYIGDTGNNMGNRQDLKIYKIPRAALNSETRVRAEVIHYSYNDQKSFKRSLHKHNYDCEAMIALNGKLYLFSKNWQDYKTRLYELSTIPGKHQAIHIATFNPNGLVTAATYNHELGILLLTTYNNLMSVNVWAFSKHDNRNFFSGQSKRLNIDPLQGQVEGITFTGNYKAYLSSEAFRKYIFSFDPALYELDFSEEFE
jgi:hypothetical protein